MLTLCNVFCFKLWEFIHNLRRRPARSQVLENSRHWNSNAANTGLTAADFWIRCDAGQERFHAPMLPLLPAVASGYFNNHPKSSLFVASRETFAMLSTSGMSFGQTRCTPSTPTAQSAWLGSDLHHAQMRVGFEIMTRTAIIRGIENLTDAQFARVAPYLQADLEAAGAGRLDEDTSALLHTIELGRESARTEPLLDDDSVFAMARQRTARP